MIKIFLSNGLYVYRFFPFRFSKRQQVLYLKIIINHSSKSFGSIKKKKKKYSNLIRRIYFKSLKIHFEYYPLFISYVFMSIKIYYNFANTIGI